MHERNVKTFPRSNHLDCFASIFSLMSSHLSRMSISKDILLRRCRSSWHGPCEGKHHQQTKSGSVAASRFPVGRNHAALRLCGSRQTYYTDIPRSMQLECKKILNPANINVHDPARNGIPMGFNSPLRRRMISLLKILLSHQ